MAGSSSCTTRSSVARRRRPAPRSPSNHAARRAATAARVAAVALGRCRSACHGWPPTRTLAVDRSPPIPGDARRRPRFGCMKHEPGGRFHVAATEDLITEQRHELTRAPSVQISCPAARPRRTAFLPASPVYRLGCKVGGPAGSRPSSIDPYAWRVSQGRPSLHQSDSGSSFVSLAFSPPAADYTITGQDLWYHRPIFICFLAD